MPRRLRIEYEGAIYHVMARGNARQKVVRDDADRRRLIEGLEHTVLRCGWELLGYVIMGNHLHLLLRTPRPNLAAGMQGFLSGYAIWAGRRHRRLGHLFQGRYRAEMIEDESYYWTVSRYIHLNPVRAGLVVRPEHWEWSSYPGYRDPRRRQPWVAHDTLLKAWRGDYRNDPARAYVRFVEAGLTSPVPSPFREAFGGWILASKRFLDELRTRSGPVRWSPTLRCLRHVNSLVSTPSGSSPPSLSSMAWRHRPCRTAMTPIWPDPSPPGSAAAIPRHRCGCWPSASDCRVPTVFPTSRVASRRA
jgi:REP element-mobilizing transposase RayT